MYRTINVYQTYLRRLFVHDRIINNSTLLLEFLKTFFNDNVLTNDNPVFSVPKEPKKFWIDKVTVNKDILRCRFNYVAYDKKTDIKDVDNLQTTKTKEKTEGDVEKQHFLIKFCEDKDYVLVALEKQIGGISISNIKKILRDALDDYVDHANKLSIEFDSLISKDFIHKLSSLDKISAIRLDIMIDNCSLDPDVLFSEQNIEREIAQLTYKAERAFSFSLHNVERQCRRFLSSPEKIVKIMVDGDDGQGPLTINTEKIILKKRISVEVDVTNHIKSLDILNKMQEFIESQEVGEMAQIIFKSDEVEETEV